MTTNRSNDASAKPRPFHRMVRRPDTLSDEVRREALSLFERGAGYKTVAQALDINVHTARDWGRLFRKGRFSPTLLYQGFIYNETVREEVRTLRNQGLSLREISRITGPHLRKRLEKNTGIRSRILRKLRWARFPCIEGLGKNAYNLTSCYNFAQCNAVLFCGVSLSTAADKGS